MNPMSLVFAGLRPGPLALAACLLVASPAPRPALGAEGPTPTRLPACDEPGQGGRLASHEGPPAAGGVVQGSLIRVTTPRLAQGAPRVELPLSPPASATGPVHELNDAAGSLLGVAEEYGVEPVPTPHAPRPFPGVEAPGEEAAQPYAPLGVAPPGEGPSMPMQEGGCFEDPSGAFPSTVQPDILQLLAVDIARRTLLALHPHAARKPIVTLAVRVRPQGHAVHTYAKLRWYRKCMWRPNDFGEFESEVSASLVYHPDRRRVFDLSYQDNAYLTYLCVDRASQIVASYNEDFALRDGVGLPPRMLSHRLDVLEPYEKPRVLNIWPVRAPDPRAKSLRSVRRDSNVTANQ